MTIDSAAWGFLDEVKKS